MVERKRKRASSAEDPRSPVAGLGLTYEIVHRTNKNWTESKTGLGDRPGLKACLLYATLHMTIEVL